MADETLVTEIAAGTFRVEHGGTRDIVYVAGSAGDRWAFWNGRVFRSRDASVGTDAGPHQPTGMWAGPYHVRQARQSLSAPMPAKVSKVLASAGSSVTKGDTLLVLEAMKMEWPIRALADGTITAIHCREGQLVQPDQVLIDLE